MFVPNLIILSQVVAMKSSTEDVHMHYIGVRDGKIETFEKEGKIKHQQFDFLLHNILGHPQDVYKVWRPRLQ